MAWHVVQAVHDVGEAGQPEMPSVIRHVGCVGRQYAVSGHVVESGLEQRQGRVSEAWPKLSAIRLVRESS